MSKSCNSQTPNMQFNPLQLCKGSLCQLWDFLPLDVAPSSQMKPMLNKSFFKPPHLQAVCYQNDIPEERKETHPGRKPSAAVTLVKKEAIIAV